MTIEHRAVLFVCLGNICRSPLAEGIFTHLVERKGVSEHFTIDSCGTGGYHIGEPPHRDSIRVAKEHGITITDQRARQVQKKDFENFDYLVAMDRQNKRDLESFGKNQGNILTLRDFDPEPDSLDVPDPYFGGPEGFYTVYDIIHRSCDAFLQTLMKK